MPSSAHLRPPWIALLAIAGVLISLHSSRRGVGVTPDSTVYLSAARSLQGGHGLRALDYRSEAPRPLTHFPPAVPTLFALAGWPDRDPVEGARRMNALLFGANIFLVGLAVGARARDWQLPALGSLLALFSPDLLNVHAMAWSEPLFLCASLTALLALAAYLERPRGSMALVAGAATALAFLTRYVGVALLVTGVACLATARDEKGERRAAHAVLFALLGGLPMGLWLARNALIAGAMIDRQIAFHPAFLSHLETAIATASSWPAAGKLRGSEPWAWVFVGQLAAWGLAWSGARAAGATHERARQSHRRSPIDRVLGTFLIVYLVTLAVNACCFEFDSRFDERALSPVHLIGLAWVLGWAAERLDRSSLRPRSVRIGLGALAILIAGAHLARGTQWIIERSRDGAVFTSRRWRASETMARARALPPGAPIFSNAPEAVSFLADRPVLRLPAKQVRGTGAPNTRFDEELEAMRAQMASGDGAIVVFDGYPSGNLPAAEELSRRLPVRVLGRYEDGAIYRLR